jgi:uncharacterized protein (DUF488 family)
MARATIYTIGHSNVSSEAFLERLRQHQITAIADVRSQPYSQYLPHFNRAVLKATLHQAGIRYVFLGRELGARSDDPTCYRNGQVVYARLAATPLFTSGLDRLRAGMTKERIALLCAEKDPATCHRAILVCRQLRHPELRIEHILSDGTLESQQDLEQRLLQLHTLNQLTFLNSQSPADLIEEAYERQGERIAYSKPDNANDQAVSISS